jgi:hypothetical protein
MLKTPKHKTKGKSIKKPLKNSWEILLKKLWSGSFWHKLMLVLAAVAIFITASGYGIAQWYIHKHSSEPLVLGTTFIPDYAESFGLDSHQTLNAIFSDLGMRHIRLVSYWNDIEPKAGTYDFSKLDWQFDMANKYGAKVSLAIGLRQPRWPECHEPDWIKVDPNHKDQWQPQLDAYMKAVIEHYKSNPALDSYQLENEFFMKVFGECKDFERSRLVSEFNMVKKQDPAHPVFISRSNNWVGIPVGQPTPDKFTISVYKRVWDATITKRYYEYPQPAWTYATLAGAEELLSGKDMQIHELQAEPWPPRGQEIINTPVAEQFKSMNAKRMKDRISYGEATGMRTVDLWGAEWWYWLMVKQNDPSVWNVVKNEVNQANLKNQRQTEISNYSN